MDTSEAAPSTLPEMSTPPGRNGLPTIVILGDFGYVEGGGSKVAINEAVLLAKHGFRVLFLAAVGPADPRLGEANVELTCLDQPGLLDFRRRPQVALQAVWNRAAYVAMQRILSPLDPANTVVHVHSYTKALSTSPVAAAHEMGFPIVCTLHDFFSACPNGAFFDYVHQTPCARVALSFDCLTTRCDKRRSTHKMFRVARSMVQRTRGHFPSAVRDYIVLSERSAGLLRPYLPEPARFHHMPNMIGVSRNPAVDVRNSDVILCVGRLDREKGVELLADTAISLGRKIVFVGDGPLRDTLAGRPGITVTGWLAPEQVVGWLNRGRCLVFPSLWFETYGLVVDEAAARGVPAIVSDVTAAAERVVDGVDGWHFVSGDGADLASKLALVADDDIVSTAGQACYNRYWSRSADMTTHIDALTGVYRTALAHDPQKA